MQYSYVGPALLVLPLFLISLVNLFVAGPPLKSIVFDSNGADYGAKLPFLELHVGGSNAKFTLTPRGEVTHFFVISCRTLSSSPDIRLDAEVTGSKLHLSDKPLMSTTSNKRGMEHRLAASHPHELQFLQPLLGFEKYDVVIHGRQSSGADAKLPPMEYRVTYVPTRFSYTQVCVRAFFTVTSLCMLMGYAFAMSSSERAREPGQVWMTILLMLLVGLNDPLYIARVAIGGNQYLYCASMLGQIAFSGGLFMFWLTYADGINSVNFERSFCSFYLPKALLVCVYVVLSATLFLAYGGLPDRLNMSVSMAAPDSFQRGLVWGLSISVIGVGLWLAWLVSQAVYRLGWKKVEYIYTEREKSFVGITVVFIILWLCGHLFRAFHGTRGSWMQLQMPFLTLTNSYLILLTHAFWPDESKKVTPSDSTSRDGIHRIEEEHEDGLLDDED